MTSKKPSELRRYYGNETVEDLKKQSKEKPDCIFIPTSLFWDSNGKDKTVSNADFKMIGTILMHHDWIKETSCTIKNKELANLMHKSIPTIASQISRMKKAGLIEVVVIKGQRHLFVPAVNNPSIVSK